MEPVSLDPPIKADFCYDDCSIYYEYSIRLLKGRSDSPGFSLVGLQRGPQ